MKSYTSPLLQHIRYLAKRRHLDPKLPETPSARGLLATYGSRDLTRSHWMQLVARDLGLEYNLVSRESRLFERFCEFNVQQKLWPTPVHFLYQPCVFERQLDALLDAADGRVTIAEAASRHSVTFEAFDFSNMVMNYVFEHVSSISFSFDDLKAPYSVIWDVWGSVCLSYKGADLRHCKFVAHYEDPTILPGANIYEANFAEADLEGVDLRHAYLRGADFVGANLAGADLRNTNTFDCCFTGARGPFVTGNVDASGWRMPR
ncbi:pentapeptide repeat-containing protein [Pseudomonas kurunegalensis]|uniref:pentapeptide repeat-containing protein n=1 Tax=Pseudomonas kurunegalensis TaxID=485880 RepID=UPI0023636F6B|nr:pentapeptide repeat-containing protein [Pseudomonas kurunegalensis]MDD2133472.1 pentapeptide repeat-containing protein [Pseudomonas kurunegalensis]